MCECAKTLWTTKLNKKRFIETLVDTSVRRNIHLRMQKPFLIKGILKRATLMLLKQS